MKKKRVAITKSLAQALALPFILALIFALALPVFLPAIAPAATVSSAALADGYAALPFGLTWECTVTEFVRALEQQSPGQPYRIMETSQGGKYLVSTSGQAATHYSAQFQGEALAGKMVECTLAEVESLPMRLDWLCYDYPPSSMNPRAIMDEFMAGYAQFASAYGPEKAEYSYIKLEPAHSNDWTLYALPRQGNGVDFEAIRRHLVENVDSLDGYWLCLGNGYANFRLYLNVSEREGTRYPKWCFSPYFIVEDDPPVSPSTPVLP